MNKSLVIFLLAVILLLTNATVLYGSAFSFAGESFDDRYNLIWEKYNFYPLVMYADTFIYDGNDESFAVIILGVKYFFVPFTDNDGFYIGAGSPTIRYLGYYNYSYSHFKEELGPAWDSSFELRGGVRFKPLKVYPSLFVDMGYSTITNYYLDLGFVFK